MAESGSPLSLDPAVLLLQIVGFVILFLLLRRYLFGPLLEVIRQREREVEEGLEASTRAKEELARVDEEKARVLTEAREQGREQVRRAVREGEEARERLLSDAREETKGLRQRAREAVELEREEAMIQLRREVVDLALLAASQAVVGRLDEKQQRAVVDDFISGLEQEQ